MRLCSFSRSLLSALQQEAPVEALNEVSPSPAPAPGQFLINRASEVHSSGRDQKAFAPAGHTIFASAGLRVVSA